MLSIPHLIIVFVVALVVFGPEKLPELARNLGKLMTEFRRATGDLRSTFEGHLRDLEREADIRRIGGSTSSPANTTSSTATNSSSSYSASPEALHEEVSTALGAVGTVPTTPPHLGIGTPVAEPATIASVSANGSEKPAANESSAEPSEHAPALDSQHNPESLTDAGIHPA
jgi:TatA/E family protein of Tat protein translocase